MWWVRALKFPSSWALNITGGKKEPKPSIMVKQAEHGKPVAFLDEVGEAIRPARGLRVEDGGKSEGRPVIGRIGISMLSHAKAG
jgi:hypothetical protein